MRFRRFTAQERKDAIGRVQGESTAKERNTQRERDLECLAVALMVERDSYAELVESMVELLEKRLRWIGPRQQHWLNEAREVLGQWGRNQEQKQKGKTV